MKIESIRTYRLSCPIPEILGFAQGRFGSRQALLVQVVTTDGLSGWGEAAGPAAVVQAAINTFYAPKLIGKNPLQTELLWNVMWKASRDFARRGVMMGAMSAIDIALWDLKGKALGSTVADLLGGKVRDRVPCYATGCYFRDVPEADLIPALLDEARSYVANGFRAIKVQIGRNLPFDRALIRALRKALPGTLLMANAHHAYDLPEAIRVGKTLEEYDFVAYEDPLSLDVPEAWRKLADHLYVPIAGGKREQTRWGFQSLLDTGGVQLLTPDFAYCGGLSEVVKIRTAASTHGVNVVPHVSGTMFSLSAALHFLASDFKQPGRAEAGVGLLEYEAPDANPLRDAMYKPTLPVESGYATLPTGAGLGIELDFELLRIFTMEKQEVDIPG
ncbi:MAG: mandelate racemase/muconate lactonizing enzyme family protein [Armatimonadetes bacterium]|nr:mandelate racemase/muconate lactonizing enzyme family protein [Armatimonadota bacterium]